MNQFDDESARRTEELRRMAAELSRDLRRLAIEFGDQMQVFAEDVKKRARGTTPFEQTPIERIRELARLRDDGIITEEEFQEQKKRLLNQV
jgi:hypothetical protein